MSSEGPKILQLILDEVRSIRSKVEKSDERLDSIDITLVRQEANLQEHMKRSDLLERRAERIETDIKPLEKHMLMVNGALKFLGIFGTIVAILVGLFEIAQFFFKI